MPSTICTYWGCNARIPRTQSRCDKHPYPIRNNREQTTSERGYGPDWRRLRDWYAEQNPICEIRHECDGAAVEHVDHIEPIRLGGARLDQDNLQSACRACHTWKTNVIDKPKLQAAGLWKSS